MAYSEELIYKIRMEYETTDISLRKLEKKHGVGHNTMLKWANNEVWTKKTDGKRKLNQKINHIAKTVVAKELRETIAETTKVIKNDLERFMRRQLKISEVLQAEVEKALIEHQHYKQLLTKKIYEEGKYIGETLEVVDTTYLDDKRLKTLAETAVIAGSEFQVGHKNVYPHQRENVEINYIKGLDVEFID